MCLLTYSRAATHQADRHGPGLASERLSLKFSARIVQRQITNLESPLRIRGHRHRLGGSWKSHICCILLCHKQLTSPHPRTSPLLTERSSSIVPSVTE